MRHDMNLYTEPFLQIRNGFKTIELRLNDEKRQKIQVNDLIFFHLVSDPYRALRCKVTSMKEFPDFECLYKEYDPLAMGYRQGDIVSYEDMYEYYPKEEIERYGAKAIGIEYLDDLYLADGHMHLEYGPLNEGYAMAFIEEGIRKGLHEVDILDHTHRFREFERCYDHLKKYEEQAKWLEGKTKFCSTLEEYEELIETIRRKDLPIRVRFGLEVCYTSNTEEMLKQILKDVKFDFLTGAVHSIDSILFDMSFSKKLLWDRYDPCEVYKHYYEEELSLIRSGLFDRLAHPDQAKLFNIETGYDMKETYERLADALKEADMYAENNTGIAYRYGHQDIGISDEMLKVFREKNVKMICASDAHKPEDVGTFIREATYRNKGMKI